MRTPERLAVLVFLRNWWPSRRKAEAVVRDWLEVIERKIIKRDDKLPLADLARFCNAGDSTFDSDPLRMAANAGRREVWLHVTAMLSLDENDTDQLLQETEE